MCIRDSKERAQKFQDGLCPLRTGTKFETTSYLEPIKLFLFKTTKSIPGRTKNAKMLYLKDIKPEVWKNATETGNPSTTTEESL